MGAKPPPKVKSRRITCKCDVCGRGFLSVQAMRSHHTVMHPKSRQRIAYKSNTEVLTERSLMTSKKDRSTMPVEKKIQEVTTEMEDSGTTNVEFKCPKCSEIFPTNFHAFKHIQKNHCVNADGESVSPNSPDIIQPIRIEVCLSCKLPVDNTNHVCPAKEEYINHAKSGLRCLACKKDYRKIMLYDLHISGIHSGDVETLFFPTLTEFNTWKRHMESQTRASYILISDSIITERAVAKRIYRCPYYLPNCNGNSSGFCPSSIVVQEYPKGHQIHFYREHYVHTTRPYKLKDAYKKYTINYIMTNKNMLSMKSKSIEWTNKYLDFKRLMENVMLEAEAANDDCLNRLHAKALEMSVILGTHNEPAQIINDSKNLSITDDEISHALNDVQTRSKRKEVTPLENSAKKIKKESNNSMKSPINFNDTFKDFVGNIVKSPTTEKKNDKKKVVKTKMGQFTPSPTKTKQKENNKLDHSNDKSEQLDDKSEVLVPKVKSEFKLDLSKVKLRTEIKYEVREQENDCNILILKI